MKIYTFKTTNKNNTPSNNNSNYSSLLDDLILSSIKKNNSYLFNTNTNCLCNKCPFSLKNEPKKDLDFVNATKFLANYKKLNTFDIPFKYGKVYYIGNTPICFYEDEIQIDTDLYSYSDFSDLLFLNKLTANKKKTIIDIYVNGLNINIKLN